MDVFEKGRIFVLSRYRFRRGSICSHLHRGKCSSHHNVNVIWISNFEERFARGYLSESRPPKLISSNLKTVSVVKVFQQRNIESAVNSRNCVFSSLCRGIYIPKSNIPLQTTN